MKNIIAKIKQVHPLSDEALNALVSEHKMSLDLGKSGSYMRSISIGKALPSMHEFLRICEYLGVTPQEFFTGAGDETDRINIFNRLQDLDDGDIQKLQTFLGWMEEK
jgi:transcriptional regulator with XRE-family HTH domain